MKKDSAFVQQRKYARNSSKTIYNAELDRLSYLKGKHPFSFQNQTNYSTKWYCRSKTICSSFPNRNEEFSKMGFEVGDDSLLNVEEKIPGKTCSLTQVSTQTLENTPGIYAIRCISTNKHLVGETKNIKTRIPKIFAELKQNKGNSLFVSEFNKFGIENFEFILYETSEACYDFQYRKFIEYRLQSELYMINCCYNSGTTETKTERPSGKFSTFPGIYCIRCKINNACYFGETGQRRGISGRLTRWKSNLKTNQAKNQILQYDWLVYGEENFEFLELESGPNWLDRTLRKSREAELKRKHENAGGIVYNTFDPDVRSRPASCPLAARSIILANKSPEYRSYISLLNKGRISENRKPIVAGNNVYFSIREAAQCLRLSRRVVRRGLESKSKTYREATSTDVAMEKNRRESEQSNAIKVDKPKRSTGFPKKVYIEGKVYPSMNQASKALGKTVQGISKSIQRGRKDYYLIDEHGNKINK